MSIPSLGEVLLEAKTLDEFLYPRSKNYPLTESWENGGIAIRDLSDDFFKHVWKGWTDGVNIFIQREGSDTIHTILDDEDITEVDITFDQNMSPCIAYVSNYISKLYWYDTVLEKYVTTVFPPEIQRPRVSLDDKRRFSVGDSDIIFAYQRGNKLCYRLQRERYATEYILSEDTIKRFLWKIGMGNNNRFLFYWR